jgi:tRNA pseudouridine13 synthase
VTSDCTRALDLPCAHGTPVGCGRIRSIPEDFIVREWLGFEPDGEGDHWLLTIRKRGANTQWVAAQLAKIAKIHPRDIGYAGLKDRNAVAEQAFTVPAKSAVANWTTVTGEGFEVLRAQRHRRKLKRGALKGNDFEIVVREFDGDRDALVERLSQIAERGVPNYFGPQRFGHDLTNLRRAYAMFRGETVVKDRFVRGFALSAARARVFNAVLARRVEAGQWNRFVPGDVANLDGSNSVFVPEAIDATLLERCERLDIHPTGPLWGAGEPMTRDDARAIEESVVDAHSVLCRGLETAGLKQERRSLRIRVGALEHEIVGRDLRLRFRLGRGAFATAVLHEILADAFADDREEAED